MKRDDSVAFPSSYNAHMTAPFALWWICLLLAAPPLTDDERHQLDTAVDGSARIDEGALYPLLRNVTRWQPDEAMRAWIDPDYQRLFDDPAAHRGELVQVEGMFYGRPHRQRLQRSGEWGDALTMWMLVLEREPERFGGVFLIDPDGHWHENAPRPGQQVRVTARFYKLWTIEDNRQVLTDYLAFVGRDPRVIGGGRGAGPDVSQMLLLVALGAAALLFILWRSRGISLRPRPLTRQEMRRTAFADHERNEKGDDVEAVDADDPDLPEDPAAALNELNRRRQPPE